MDPDLAATGQRHAAPAILLRHPTDSNAPNARRHLYVAAAVAFLTVALTSPPLAAAPGELAAKEARHIAGTFPGRMAGTLKKDAAAKYIADRLLAMGYQPRLALPDGVRLPLGEQARAQPRLPQPDLNQRDRGTPRHVGQADQSGVRHDSGPARASVRTGYPPSASPSETDPRAARKDSRRTAPFPSIECPSFLLAKCAILDSDAVTVATLGLIEEELLAGTLAPILEQPWKQSNWMIVKLRGRSLGPAALVLVEELRLAHQGFARDESMLRERWFSQGKPRTPARTVTRSRCGEK